MTRESIKMLLKQIQQESTNALEAIRIDDKKNFAYAITRLEIISGPLSDITELPKE